MKGLQTRRLLIMAGPRVIAALLTCMISSVMSHITPMKCAEFQTSGFFRDNNLQTQFLLFTPKNPKCAELIQANETQRIKNSAFNASLDTKVLIHGFRALGTKPSWIDSMVESLLTTGKVNVVAVDWVCGATAKYNQAVENVPRLSREVVALINCFLELGSTEPSLHLVGVSLGAHVAGYIGHYYGGRIGRITGLDPAGYKFTHSHPEERLDPSDAMFVEAVHTDTDNFGIRIPVGHVDYFVNGGRDQPGCPSLRNSDAHQEQQQEIPVDGADDCDTRTKSELSFSLCAGMKSLQVPSQVVSSTTGDPGAENVTDTVHREDSRPDVHKEDSTTGVYREYSTTGVHREDSTPDTHREYSTPDVHKEYSTPSVHKEYSTPGVHREDSTPDVPQVQVSIFMFTTTSEPFCAHHILLEFKLMEPKENVIALNIELISTDTSTSKAKITVPRRSLEGRGLAAHLTPLCQVDMIVLRTSSSFMSLRRKKAFSGWLCLAELPLGSRQDMTCLPETLTFSGSGPQTHNIADIRDHRCQ
ncbi:phospholipase A1 member A [Ranitomeya imitator]|uniref:phospholipase A1 member A n=1 Tax=Ranitomeya imitator TaxID=111125 RepID=UPI0037E72D8B